MNVDLSLVGYAAAALTFAGLAGLLALRGAPTRSGRFFLLALGAQSLWAALLAANAHDRFEPVLIALFEALRWLLWLIFLLVLLRQSGEREARRIGDAGMVLACGLAIAVIGERALGLGDRLGLSLQVVGSVGGLVCVEQIYRNTPEARRWAMKFLAIAGAAMFGFDLLLFSEALLFSRLNENLWTARAYANTVLAPLLAVAAARNQNWKLDIAVSRTVVFHSAALSAAGLFMVLMAAGGYWVRYIGGSWGETAQALLLFGALVGLLIMLGSGSLRARLKVLLAKHFFSYRYDYRAEWLKLTELLSESPHESQREPLEIRALRALGGLIDSQGGALWMLNDDGQYACTARWRYQAPTPVVDARDPMPLFLARQQWIISLPQWRARPDYYQGLTLPEAIREAPDAWCVVPLMLNTEALGFAVLCRPLAKAELDWEVRDALKTAARQVASYLGVRQAVEALVQARQFESFNRMSAFVVHDLKNLVAQLSLLLTNAPRHRDNPEFQRDMIDTVANVQERMQGLLMQLRAGTRPIEQPGAVVVAQAIAAAVRSKRGREPVPELLIDAPMRDAVVLAHRDRLERVIGHLIQNAGEATPPDGNIWVRLSRDGEHIRLEVEDTGRGMSEQFIRERLFRPFQSTKANGMGIGSFESREYIRELGGSLEVESQEGKGTVFRMRLPLAMAEEPA